MGLHARRSELIQPAKTLCVMTYCGLHLQMPAVRTHRRCERISDRFLPQQSSRARVRSLADAMPQRSVMHPAPPQWNDLHHTFGGIIIRVRSRLTAAASFVTLCRSRKQSRHQPDSTTHIAKSTVALPNPDPRSYTTADGSSCSASDSIRQPSVDISPYLPPP